MRNAVLLWLSSWVPLKIPACNGEVKNRGNAFFSLTASPRVCIVVWKSMRVKTKDDKGADSRRELDGPQLYFDRELALSVFSAGCWRKPRTPRPPSWTGEVPFHRRSNLAEFFMVRVAGLKQQFEAGITEPSPAGLTPLEQLRTVRRAAQELMNDTRTCLRKLLGP